MEKKMVKEEKTKKSLADDVEKVIDNLEFVANIFGSVCRALKYCDEKLIKLAEEAKEDGKEFYEKYGFDKELFKQDDNDAFDSDVRAAKEYLNEAIKILVKHIKLQKKLFRKRCSFTAPVFPTITLREG